MTMGRMLAGLRKFTALVGSHSQFNDWCFQLDGVVRQVPCGQVRQASAGSGMLVKRQVRGALQPRSLTGERSELPFDCKFCPDCKFTLHQLGSLSPAAELPLLPS